MKQSPKVSRLSILKAVTSLLETGARQAVVYQHPKLCVKATLRFKPDKRAARTDIVLTIGPPNYEGRLFVKRCQQSGEPFPVAKVQLCWWKKNQAQSKTIPKHHHA